MLAAVEARAARLSKEFRKSLKKRFFLMTLHGRL
jgi:hypothetical protein